MKPFLVVISASVILSVSIIGLALRQQFTSNNDISSIDTIAATATPTLVATPTPTPAPSNTAALPDHALLDVPYTLQAPYAIFDALHEDSCEETSLLMVYHFQQKTPIGDDAAADQQIIDLVHYGEKMGQGPSITLDQLNQLAQSYYHMSGTVKVATSADDIKRELAAGKPVIAPLAGKLLFSSNPYFSNGGPNYHMLVIKGYDATGFITNEPGTYHGNGYHYDYDVIMNALHDWNPNDILQGQSAYLVF